MSEITGQYNLKFANLETKKACVNNNNSLIIYKSSRSKVILADKSFEVEYFYLVASLFVET